MPTPKSDLRVASSYIDDLSTDATVFHRQAKLVQSNPDLTPDAKARQVAALHEQYDPQRRDAIEFVQGKLAQVKADAGALLTAQSDDLAQQLLLTRAANRVARLLDANVPLGQIIAVLSEGKDLTGLQALREEIPAISAKHNDQDQRDAFVSDTTTALHQAMRPLLPGDQADAIDALTHLPAEAARLDMIVEHSVLNSGPSLSRMEIAQDLADDSARRTGFTTATGAA